MKKKPSIRNRLTKIKPAAALARAFAKERKARKLGKLVFTNGCFDLLHKGHVSYLEAARKKGDTLVVALNADDSVRRLKGADRPLNKLEDRLEVMAALECVDYVTWFEDDTPLSVIVALRPDVLVKGGDWKPEQIVGSKEVLESGGKVLSLPYIEGKSTSALIQKARETGEIR
jgi:rfaE bifunctional protein nucleotidyltransferase chain/domain